MFQLENFEDYIYVNTDCREHVSVCEMVTEVVQQMFI